MNNGRCFWLGFLLIAIVSPSGCRKPPEPKEPFVLNLQLARRTWHVGESPWYLLQAKNVGHKRRFLDPFWYDQAKLDDNSDYRAVYGVKGHETYFEIRRPDGRVMTPDCMAAWGMHKEFRFWANAEGDPKAWPLKPGQTMAATASIVAPVKMQRRNVMGPADARIPPNATPAERESYAELWKQYKGELSEGGRANDYSLEPKVLYPGYRILECYFFSKPGIYRMKAVMDETHRPTPLSAEEEIQDKRKNLFRSEPPEAIQKEIREKWANMSLQQMEQRKKRRALEDKWAREDPGFYVESNVVEVEVAP
ncbi:MAG: hypothetical protein PHU21_06585 [Elusimicrobia bacterium]|nr:hypothetical protein [Elusimicrobiota bacterium]